MNEYLEKFNESIQSYFIEGHRNNNLPAVAEKAVFYDIDYYTALNSVKSFWGSDMTKIDENSFRRAYENEKRTRTRPTVFNLNGTSVSKVLTYAKEKKAIETVSKESELQAKCVLAFDKHMKYLKENLDVEGWLKENKPEQPKDSSFLLNVFDKNDWVWLGHTPISQFPESEIRDMLTFAKSKVPLKTFNYFCANPFKDPSVRNDDNIKDYRYMLLECDNIDIEDQLRLMVDMILHKVPIKMATYSGSKSIHMLVKVNGVETKEEWDEFVDEIFTFTSRYAFDLFDTACKNPSRLTRTPGAIRDVGLEKHNQTLYFLQNDEAVLNVDTKEKILDYFKSIYDEPKAKSPENEIDDSEILALVKNNFWDIWNDGGDICTLTKDELKVWKNEHFFYSHITDILSGLGEDREQVKKALKLLRVPYKRQIYEPYIGTTHIVKKDTVNTFIPGWLGEALEDKSIPDTLEKPLEILLDNIFGEDEKTKAWTLQWMRDYMHTFEAMTAPVFWEIQGTGKTMLSKAFGGAVGDWFKVPPNRDDFTFNDWLLHTVVIFEESSSGSRRDGKDLGDLLKDWITEKEKTIVKKGKDPIKVKTHTCFIFNANVTTQIAPVFLEDSDRRYTIVRNDNAKNLIHLWSDEDFDKWNSGYLQKELMKWIYNLPKDPTINTKIGLNNKWKQEVTQLSKGSIEQAVEDMIETIQENSDITSGWISNFEIIERLKKEYGVANASMCIVGKILAKKGFVKTSKRVEVVSDNDGLKEKKSEVRRGWIISDQDILERI